MGKDDRGSYGDLRRRPRPVQHAMNMYVAFEDFTKSVAAATDNQTLSLILNEMTHKMGFSWFAITHHIQAPTLRISNYPDEWVEYFDRNGLGLSDPVHRTSNRSGVGFRWERFGDIIDPTARDHQIFELARRHDIADGFTIPFNVANEPHGSCSFAVGTDGVITSDMLPVAQLAGLVAFERARQFWRTLAHPSIRRPKLTDRQRDCLLWAARGKSAWEISLILGIKEATVVRHLKQALERYGVPRRSSLLILAMFDGTLSFTDIFEHGYTHFWE